MPLHTRSILLLFLSSHAWADDTPTVTTTADVDQPARYPRAVIARPLTLPGGLVVAGGDVVADHDFGTLSGNPIAGFGVTDDLEVLLAYAFTAKELEAKGSVNADVGYQLLRGAAGGKLELIARVRGGYNVLEEATNPVMIGLHAQYNLTDAVAVISGVPGTQQLRIAVEDTDGMMPIDLSAPIGLGVQASGTLYFQLDTKLAQLDLHESNTAVIGADTTPVSFTAVCNALPALDVQAAIATDLNDAGDALTFLVGARYYAGAL